MLAILKLFVMILFVVLFFSALCGVVVFISDIKRFKLDTQMSLPRQKLIERYVDQQELEKGGDNNAVCRAGFLSGVSMPGLRLPPQLLPGLGDRCGRGHGAAV